MAKTSAPVIEDEPVLDPTEPRKNPGNRNAEPPTRRPPAHHELHHTREPQSVDIPDDCENPGKFLIENGLPKPTKRYRVTISRAGKLDGSHECNAVDESEAISFAIQSFGVKEPHRYVFHAVCVD